jgi:hypothetical protein
MDVLRLCDEIWCIFGEKCVCIYHMCIYIYVCVCVMKSSNQGGLSA